MKMIMTSDLMEALQQLPDRLAAKKIADYMEETKQLNLDRMKEIFMTKDDKIELIAMTKADKIELMREILATKEDLYKVKDELHKEISSAKWQVIFVIIGVVLLQPVIASLYKHFFGM